MSSKWQDSSQRLSSLKEHCGINDINGHLRTKRPCKPVEDGEFQREDQEIVSRGPREV